MGKICTFVPSRDNFIGKRPSIIHDSLTCICVTERSYANDSLRSLLLRVWKIRMYCKWSRIKKSQTNRNKKRRIPESLSCNLYGLLGSKGLMHKGRPRLSVAGKANVGKEKKTCIASLEWKDALTFKPEFSIILKTIKVYVSHQSLEVPWMSVTYSCFAYRFISIKQWMSLDKRD